MRGNGVGGSLVSDMCIDTKALLLAMTSRKKDGNNRTHRDSDNDDGVHSALSGRAVLRTAIRSTCSELHSEKKTLLSCTTFCTTLYRSRALQRLKHLVNRKNHPIPAGSLPSVAAPGSRPFPSILPPRARSSPAELTGPTRPPSDGLRQCHVCGRIEIGSSARQYPKV